MKRKYIILVLLFLLVLPLFSCKQEENQEVKEPEKVDDLCIRIDFLPTKIKISDEETINECMDIYNSLDDYDKTFVYNYDILEEAFNTINTLKGLNDIYELAYNEAVAYVKENMFDNVDAGVDLVNLINQYVYTKDGNNYPVDITWISTDPYTLSGTGIVSHKINDATITLTATFSSTKVSIIKEESFDVLVKKREMHDLSKKPAVIGYFNYSIRDLSEDEIKLIDIIQFGFGQISKTEANSEVHFTINTSGLGSLQTLVNDYHKHGIRIVLSFGGWHNDSSFWDTYSLACSKDEYRKEVANEIVKLVTKYDIDGVDFDWEYPQAKDRENFTLLMQEIRDALNKISPNYLINISIPGGSWVNGRYDLCALDDILDYICIMSYDFDSGATTTVHHTSLYASSYATISIESSIAYLENLGVRKDKICLGGAWYGRLFKGVKKNTLGASFDTKESITYTNIYNNYLNRVGNGVTTGYDDVAHSYYLYDEAAQEMVTYESCESIKEKCEFVIEKGYAGIMFWSLNCDTTNELAKAMLEGIN